MRKIILSLAGLLTFGGIMAQPVSDNAVIPISVTLNSILRLNVTTGGNIEFVVNTMDQYTLGILNNDRYTTTFTVASSQDFDVLMYAEDGQLNGTEIGGTPMSLDNIGYQMRVNASASGVEGTNWDLVPAAGTTTNLKPAATTTIVESIATFGAGDINQNKFDIMWELGTSGSEMNSNSLLQQSIKPDRYSTNVFLVLVAN